MKYKIEKFSPCSEALNFYNSFETAAEAWEKCERGDWMLWIASKLQVDVKKLVLAKALCANTVRNLMRDKRSKEAVYVALRFGRGKATNKELNAAYDAAAAAAAAAYDAAAAAAAAAYDAAADAAAAADADADAAAAADADAAAAYDAAKKENRMKTANICRKILTEVVFEKIG
jgi:hypothetical protein